MQVRFSYDPGKFDASIVDQIAGQFRHLLQAIVADPERRLDELAALMDTEQERLLLEWGRETVSPPKRHRRSRAAQRGGAGRPDWQLR